MSADGLPDWSTYVANFFPYDYISIIGIIIRGFFSFHAREINFKCVIKLFFDIFVHFPISQGTGGRSVWPRWVEGNPKPIWLKIYFTNDEVTDHLTAI